ncbi:MAG: hypothetical protein ACLS6G_08845 [Christensenellales bacterium]
MDDDGGLRDDVSGHGRLSDLRPARGAESIEESSKRDMEVVMEQLEKPYATRLNTSDELTETMERYLFSQGRREIDLAADGRFLSALNGKSVRDVLFVTTDGHYVSVRGRTGWQKMDRENSGRLTAGKTVSGYRSWNGEEAFFVVKPIEPFFVQGEPYDAIALAYTPGSVNGALSFCAYGGQANVCIIKQTGARSMPRTTCGIKTIFFCAMPGWRKRRLRRISARDKPDAGRSKRKRSAFIWPIDPSGIRRIWWFARRPARWCRT